MTKQIQTVEHGGIMRVINRKDVGNIISSINMTLKDYGIRFELDDKENLKCVSDGVPDMLAQAQQEAVEIERERILQAVRKVENLYRDEFDEDRKISFGRHMAFEDCREAVADILGEKWGLKQLEALQKEDK